MNEIITFLKEYELNSDTSFCGVMDKEYNTIRLHRNVMDDKNETKQRIKMTITFIDYNNITINLLDVYYIRLLLFDNEELVDKRIDKMIYLNEISPDKQLYTHPTAYENINEINISNIKDIIVEELYNNITMIVADKIVKLRGNYGTLERWQILMSILKEYKTKLILSTL